MKRTTIKRWKPKKFKRYQYRELKITGRSKNKQRRQRKLIGKYFILLSTGKAKYGAIIKFITKRLCMVEQAVLVTESLIKHTSSKFIITPKKNKRLLETMEVTFTEQNVEDFKAVASLSEVMTELEKEKKIAKKVTPLKILSCATCNHKFTRRQHYEQHLKEHTKTNPASNSSSSGSEAEMVIDDDCILVLDDNDFNIMKDPPVPLGNGLNFKQDPDEAKTDELYCMVEDCGEKFDKEESLTAHIAASHERQEERPFKCKKCGDGFRRESGLIAHDRIKHAVEVIDIPEVEPKKRTRRKSVFISNKPLNNGSVSTPAPSTTSKEQNAQPVISFALFDSSQKKSFICHICSTVFLQREYLDRHVFTQHIVKSYVCYHCKVGFQKLNLLAHMKTEHIHSIKEPNFIASVNDIESTAIFRCCFCRFSVKSRSRVSDHMKNEHYEEFEKNETIEENFSSPDSLENLVLPETAKLIEDELDLLVEDLSRENVEEQRTRKKRNDPSFRHRCAHCLNNYAKLSVLKTHRCIPGNTNGSHKPSESSSKKSSPPRIKKTVIPPSKAAELAVSIFASNVKKRTSTTTSIISQMRNAKCKKSAGFFGCQMCPAVFTDKEMFNDHTLNAHVTKHRPL